MSSLRGQGVFASLLNGRWQSRRSWNGQALQRPLEKLVLARLLEERMRF